MSANSVERGINSILRIWTRKWPAEAIRRSHLSDTLQRGEEKPGGSSPGVWRSMGSNGGRVGQGYFPGRKAPEHEKPIAMTMAFCFQSRIVRRTNPLDSSILPMSKHPQYEVHAMRALGRPRASLGQTLSSTWEDMHGGHHREKQNIATRCWNSSRSTCFVKRYSAASLQLALASN